MAFSDEYQDVADGRDVRREDEAECQVVAAVPQDDGAQQGAKRPSQVPERGCCADPGRAVLLRADVADVAGGGGKQAHVASSECLQEGHEVDDLNGPRALPVVQEIPARVEEMAGEGQE